MKSIWKLPKWWVYFIILFIYHFFIPIKLTSGGWYEAWGIIGTYGILREYPITGFLFMPLVFYLVFWLILVFIRKKRTGKSEEDPP